MDSAQYAELFLTESREHVSAINHSLLALERGGGGAGGGGSSAASDAVSAIFRAVHTIKGMSATMGYTVVAELSHELETVLDRVRRGALALDGGAMDLLFKCADLLEQSIEGAVAGKGDVPIADVVARLRRLGQTPALGVPVVPGGAPVTVAAMTPPTTSTPPAGASAWTIPAPAGQGTLVRIRINPGTPLKGVRAFLVVQALRRLGEVLHVAPPLDRLQADQFDHDFALRLVGSAPAEEIERVARGAGDVADVEVGESAAAVVPAAQPPLAEAIEIAPSARADAPGTPGGDGAEGSGVRQQRHVRIDLRRLDALMNLIGELVVTRGRLSQLANDSQDPALQDTVTQASRLIGDLRDEIMTSRMVPVWQVFDRFPRLVRDASRALGKRIEFTIEGKDIELDRSMLDEIGDPIVHLLRNAVDHGIEPPDARVAAGKPPAGRLQLSAVRDRSAVVIRVTDDGRGIDREKVLAKAKANGLIDAAKTELTDDELFRLVARPGFSTADRVTDLSGRGVGIDAVYTRVRSLGGAVDMRSIPGQGTTVTLRLPLTLAIVRALLAKVNDEIYAVPLTHVSETVELLPEVRRTLRGKEVIVLRDDVLPLLRLRELVGLPPREDDGTSVRHLEQVVVIDLADRRAGLVVDDLTGQQEIVVKQFDAVRDGLSIFGGATILGDGSPALIVDVSSLL